jgi:asparagine synthase (glutamine-hydrolysing)
MCGIFGIIKTEAKRYEKNLQDMEAALLHRGPDEQGRFFFNDCALGHVRLSIIDLKTGQQPMLTPDKKIGVVFNGEIYGYQKLRASIDFPYQTNSDTEVIIAAWKKYNEDAAAHLPGMFAFGVWDDAQKTFYGARDRFGEKPFYYAIGTNGEFIFASEIKAILASGLIRPVLDKESLIHYLKHLYVRPDKTIYKNIFTLPPAHQLVYQNEKISTRRYWSFPNLDHKITLEDAAKKFQELLDAAVKSQLVSDVPIGAFLSGGLDSSTIVALASRYKKPLKTYSFGFNKAVSELPYAKEIADKYQTEHTELYDDVDIAEMIMKMAEIYDEPFADSSCIPTYLISRLAKKYVTVVLTGDGGDELLGGYGRYKSLLAAEENDYGRLSLLKYYVAKISAKLKINADYRRNTYYHQGALLKNKFSSTAAAAAWQNSYFKDKDIKNFGLDKLAVKEDYHFPEHDRVDYGMRMDLENYMPGDILVKTDRAAMASALELRAPFLDVDFASFCLSLPYSFKVSRAEDKIIMRRAFGDAWTESIRKRSKQGFGAPVEEWLKIPAVKTLKEKYLNDPGQKMFKIIPFAKTRKYAAGNSYQTWILLVLAIWMEKYDFDF